MADKENSIVKSLDKISSKLEDINNTLKEPKTVEAKADWNSRIENLILQVDRECGKKRFTTRRLRFIVMIIIVSFSIAIAVVIFNFYALSAILSYANYLNNATLPSNETIPAGLNFLGQQLPAVDSIAISAVAILVALLSIMIPLIIGESTPAQLADEYYEKLSRDISEEEKPFLPYLKALVNMKCKEFDLSLMDNYHNSVRLKSNLFTEQSLLRNLYLEKND